jgi:hypothetical protein
LILLIFIVCDVIAEIAQYRPHIVVNRNVNNFFRGFGGFGGISRFGCAVFPIVQPDFVLLPDRPWKAR